MRLTNKIMTEIQPVITICEQDPSMLSASWVRSFINDHIDAFIAYDLQQIKEFEKKYGIHFTTAHTGKMLDVWSLSTSPLTNKRCGGRCKVPGTICAECYSVAMNARYRGLDNSLRRNSDVLYHNVIPVNEWPLLFSRDIFRIESFGDLATVIQGINYLNFAIRNPHVAFAIYTKNPDILAAACNMVYHCNARPGNLSVVYSSPYINVANDATYHRYEWLIDHVFTVVDRNGVEQIGGVAAINCGARSCNTCRLCYFRNGILHIWELLKSQARSILLA